MHLKCVTKLAAPGVELRGPNIMPPGERGQIIAMLSLSDDRQLLLQAPGAPAPNHRSEYLGASKRLRTNSSAGVQCARKCFVIHHPARLPQSRCRARWGQGCAYVDPLRVSWLCPQWPMLNLVVLYRVSQRRTLLRAHLDKPRSNRALCVNPPRNDSSYQLKIRLVTTRTHRLAGAGPGRQRAPLKDQAY